MVIPKNVPERCEACGELFMDTHADGSKIRHEHHLIPRAYGGAEGPTTHICDEDHDLVHMLATKVIHHKLTFDQIPAKCDGEKHARAIQVMVYYIVAAEKRSRNDPNKRSLVSLSLSGKETRKLDVLMDCFNVSSRAHMLVRLIEMEYRRSIPTIRKSG